MSEIFDALQRSEAESADGHRSQLASDLLRRQERRALMTGHHQNDQGQHYSSISPDSRLSDATVSTSHSQEDILFHVRSLPVSPPAGSRLVSLMDPDSAAAEAFRLLAVRIQQMRKQRDLTTLLITSAIPQEGKSTVAANLACTLAQATQDKVLLLEGDIRRSTLSQALGAREYTGLCELLRKKATLSESMLYFSDAHLWALLAGKPSGNLLDALQPPQLSALVDQLKAWFDWIIIDSPPLLATADTSVWSTLADGILFVARYGTSNKKDILRSVRAIDSQKLVGAVLNCSTSLPHSNYYYGRTSIDHH